jgi:S1-C subfamily serine protease
MNAALTEWGSARRALVARAAGNVVGIDRGRGLKCSGIVWDSETLITAAEVLRGADAVIVLTAHESVPAQLLACDLSLDIAVLRARTGAAGIAAQTSTELASADDVLVAGRHGTESVAFWTQVEEVGPAWRSRRGGELDRLITLSRRLPPWLEGGGTFDLEGRLCAMSVRGPRHRTLGIPVETIERVVTNVLRHGRLAEPYIGVRLQPVRLDEPMRATLARSGWEAAVVIGVEPASPAAAAGLLFGDLILSISGQPIENGIDLKVALARLPIGSSIGLQVYRAGSMLDTTVTVGDRNIS